MNNLKVYYYKVNPDVVNKILGKNFIQSTEELLKSEKAPHRNYKETIKTKDGKYVRSIGEFLVCNTLVDRKIKHEHRNRITKYRPDFFVNKYSVYIEIFGMMKTSFRILKEYPLRALLKMEFYAQKNIPFIAIFFRGISETQEKNVREIGLKEWRGG